MNHILNPVSNTLFAYPEFAILKQQTDDVVNCFHPFVWIDILSGLWGSTGNFGFLKMLLISLTLGVIAHRNLTAMIFFLAQMFFTLVIQTPRHGGNEFIKSALDWTKVIFMWIGWLLSIMWGQWFAT